jgi:hypothetical protein
MPYLVGFITPQDYGATGNGVTDDTTAINNALLAVNAAGGGTVFLPWGTYLISGPINIPPFTFLVGQTEVSLLVTTQPSVISRLVASASWAPGATTGMVNFASKTPGGWSVVAQSSGLQNIYLDGSLNASTNLSGIYFNGPVYDTHLDNVYINAAPHNGVHIAGVTEPGIVPTFPYHHRWNRVTTTAAGNLGFNLSNFTDSTFTNCMAFSSTAANWTLSNNSNTIFTSCRAEWSSGGRGWSISGSAGSVVLDGCTSDQNAGEGLLISGATGQATQGGGIVVSGGKFHADGNGGVNNRGIRVTASTVPVTITGVNVESGQNVNNSNWYPATGIQVDTSANVTVSGCTFQGISNPWVDGGGNSYLIRKGCIGLTGNPNTQTSSVLSDLPAPNTALPDDQGLLAWTYDTIAQNGSSTPGTGVVQLSRINVRTTMTITNILVAVAATGTGLTSGQNFVGLYNSAGTLLSASADQTTPWGTTGLKTAALSAAQTVNPGIYYVAILANAATTTPGFARATVQGAATVNAGATASAPRYATSGTGQTTLPGSITLSSSTQIATAWWAAVS